jgi:phosphoribosyl 1,2-cyclic phosphodiesterase
MACIPEKNCVALISFTNCFRYRSIHNSPFGAFKERGKYMKFALLRSGSSGNCSFFEHNDTCILIDAGMSQKRIKEVLEEVGKEPESINAIINTHLHADHLNYSTLQICRKFNIPLWVHQRNIGALKTSFKKEFIESFEVNCYSDTTFSIGEMVIQPFEVSHDAYAVTSGFSIRPENEAQKFITYAADLGIFPDHLIPFFKDSRAIILEANHDTDLLWKNPLRPYMHKKRVAGDCGHLSNIQSADALVKIVQASSKQPELVVLCHLSQDHNTPELAIKSITDIINKHGLDFTLEVALRHERTRMFEFCD